MKKQAPVSNQLLTPGLKRILERDYILRQRSLEWRRKYGDPIEALQQLGRELIGSSPEAIEAWRILLTERY